MISQVGRGVRTLVTSNRPSRAQRKTLDTLRAHETIPPVFASTRSRDTVLNIIGGGPAATETVHWLAQLFADYKPQMNELEKLTGKRFSAQVNVIERRPVGEIAQGNAWAADHGNSSMNTGIEPRAVEEHKFGRWITDRSKLLGDTIGSHPMLKALFKSGFNSIYKKTADQKVTDHRSFLPRAVAGKYYQERFAAMLLKASQRLDVKLVTDTTATAIELGSGEEPAITTLSHSGNESKVKADLTMLATGTTLTSPITDESITEFCYQTSMNTEEVGRFLNDRGLLDPGTGKLAEGAKIGMGGTSLSLFDQLIAIAPHMDLFVEADGEPGYKINEAAAEKYQGALTIVSASKGNLVNPRTALEPAGEWTQTEPPLSSSSELWASVVTNPAYALKAYDKLAYAAIAHALGTTMQEVMKRAESTAELALAQKHDIEHFFQHMTAAKNAARPEDAQAEKMQASQSPSAALRQYHSAIYEGKVPSTDPSESMRRLKDTFGFAGDLVGTQKFIQMFMSKLTAGGASADSMRIYNKFFSDVAASPVHVQMAAGMLFESGIALHHPARYDAMQHREEGKPIVIMDVTGAAAVELDAFIVSPQFNADTEFSKSLVGQVQPIHDELPQFPITKAGRTVVAADGRPTSVLNFGLQGAGRRIASGSTYGSTTIDINNHPSSMDAGRTAASFMMSVIALRTVEHPSPIGETIRLFEEAMSKAMNVEAADEGAVVSATRNLNRQLIKKTEMVTVLQEAMQADAQATANVVAAAIPSRPGTPDMVKAVKENLGEEAATTFETRVAAKLGEIPSHAEILTLIRDLPSYRRDGTVQECKYVTDAAFKLAKEHQQSKQAA